MNNSDAIGSDINSLKSLAKIMSVGLFTLTRSCKVRRSKIVDIL
jgi:hypothetical protein